MVRQELPQAWWFDSRNNNSRQSPWLTSTLLELEKRTKQMLKLIEEDAESFAQRAEMYYKKRPLIVDMIGDLYRDHRSLAEHCDQLKSLTRLSHPKQTGVPVLSSLRWTSSDSSTYSSESASESEVDDPEPVTIFEMESEPDNSLETELKKLREDNKALKEEMQVKDEEKREAIRQLSYYIDLLKEENRSLKRHMKEPATRGSGGGSEVMRWTKDIFSGKIFMARRKSGTTVVAL